MISVIVPVYNVEKYVGKCIESILKQTYTDFELILVNDGSTDHSYDICCEYKKKDSRIKIINKKNGGLSDARNVGIDASLGEYITFIDSDDFISRYMFEFLHNILIKNNADIAICSFLRVCENENPIDKIPSEMNIQLLNSEECYEAIYSSKCDEFTVAWGKLYRRKLFDAIRYPYGKLHEDEFVTYKLYSRSEKVVYVPIQGYYYLNREQSIMNTKFSTRSLDRLDAYQEREDFFCDIGREDFAALAAQRFIDKSAGYFISMYPEKKKYCDKIENIRTISKLKYARYSSQFKYECLRQRIRIMTFCKCLPLFFLHHEFIKIGIRIKRGFKSMHIGDEANDNAGGNRDKL